MCYYVLLAYRNFGFISCQISFSVDMKVQIWLINVIKIVYLQLCDAIYEIIPNVFILICSGEVVSVCSLFICSGCS